MSEYAHFHTLSHHQLQSCRNISRGLPPVAVSEKQAAVGEILKKSTVSAALPFLLLAQVEIFMHRERKEGHASRFFPSCLLRKHCFLDSPQSMTQLRLGIDTHTVLHLFVAASFWQCFGR